MTWGSWARRLFTAGTTLADAVDRWLLNDLDRPVVHLWDGPASAAAASRPSVRLVDERLTVHLPLIRAE